MPKHTHTQTPLTRCCKVLNRFDLIYLPHTHTNTHTNTHTHIDTDYRKKKKRSDVNQSVYFWRKAKKKKTKLVKKKF